MEQIVLRKKEIQMNKTILIASMFACLSVAQASVVSVTGVDVQIFNPLNVAPGVVQSNFVNVFDEQQAVTLATTINLSHTATGLLNTPGGAVPGSVAAGSMVHSHFIHFDPAANASRSGSATFSRRILGVIYDNPGFSATNSMLGLSGNTYGTVTGAYGLELGANSDSIGISADRLTLNFNLSANNPGDRIRVITVVPEATTVVPMLAGLAMLLRRKR
jgi:hypothetical protein